MDCPPAARLAAPRLAAPRRSAGFFTGLFTRLAEWRERAEQRAHLAGMDERMLKDIGVNHVDAAHESSKPFWKA
jgi:uncharacterized protein YjiS (DUF1127 family)